MQPFPLERLEEEGIGKSEKKDWKGWERKGGHKH
jgi:hypothetical protein